MLPGEPRRVAYVLKMYPRLAETFILNEIIAHEASGLHLDIFSLRSPIDGRFHHDLSRVRADVTYLPGPSSKAEEFWTTLRRAARELPGGDRLLEFAGHDPSPDVYQGMQLAFAARDRGVEHLHAHFATSATTVARIASLLTGIPYSFTAHAKDIFHHDTVDDDDLRRKLSDAAAVVTVSDFNVGYLRERYADAADSVRRIYNGVDLTEFPFNTPDERAPLVLGVGRFVDKKGFADLIEAAAILRDRGRSFTCEIIGDGVLRERLERRISDLGVGDVVHMAGARPREAVRERMRAAALLAVPCVVSDNGNRDGLPTVLLEAMALGTPCISTDVTGIPEVLRDGETGLLTPEHDPVALADAIERLLDDADLRRRVAERARRLMEADFDIHVNTPVLRSVFASRGAAAMPATSGVAAP